ncbi:hypothetical protein B0H10DRAFT_1985337 [Mycena sp. CBHHK59/15]|nr:hypothetical protein B0H10DRAFT_1985337 [Mycena sp. CBHHK59/15]
MHTRWHRIDSQGTPPRAADAPPERIRRAESAGSRTMQIMRIDVAAQRKMM